LWKRDPAVALVGDAHARIVVPPEARGGFEFWEGFESGFLLNDPWLHGTRLPEPVRVVGYQSDVLCERASAWIRGAWSKAATQGAPGPQSPAGSAGVRRRPWFCLVSLEAPHPPYGAPANGVVPMNPEAITLASNVPRGGEVEAMARRELAGYHAHVQATDASVGRLLDALRAADARAFKNTVVVFTSVHGDMHGAHGLFRKGWPQEESVRVPLLIRVPGGAPGERRDPVSLLDLSRMLGDLADRGTLPPVNSEAALISMPSVVALPHQCDRVWRGLRSATRKLVLAEGGRPWLFFDLERDPGECRNLVADPSREAEIAALSRMLD
jgi:hypothetical protein